MASSLRSLRGTVLPTPNAGGEPYGGVVCESWTKSFGVFDLETTGIDVRTSRIVTAHIGVLDAEGVLVGSHEWLADPGVEIPPQASAVHGVTTERARAEGRPAGQVVG